MLHHLFSVLADSNTPTGWTVLGVLTAGVLALANRMIDSAKFRTGVHEELGKLKQKDQDQQILITKQAEDVRNLQKAVTQRETMIFAEREMNHTCRNRLNAASQVIALYRKLHGQDKGDSVDLTEFNSVYPKKDGL